MRCLYTWLGFKKSLTNCGNKKNAILNSRYILSQVILTIVIKKIQAK